jgi:hypothetical protein
MRTINLSLIVKKEVDGRGLEWPVLSFWSALLFIAGLEAAERGAEKNTTPRTTLPSLLVEIFFQPRSEARKNAIPVL